LRNIAVCQILEPALQMTLMALLQLCLARRTIGSGLKDRFNYNGLA